MVRRWHAVVVAAALVLGAASACAGGSSGGGESAPDRGVSAEAVRVGLLLPDVDGIRASGIPLSERLTNANLAAPLVSAFERWNADGGIHGRTIEYEEITWDPLDETTLLDACTKATVDNELFMVVAGVGFDDDYIDCFTKDGDTLFLGGSGAGLENYEGAGPNLITLGPPPAVAAANGIEIAVEEGLLDEDSVVGILAGDTTSDRSLLESVKANLDEAGIEVAVDRPLVPIASLDTNAINQTARTLVPTMREAGVDVVVTLLPTAGGPTAFVDEAAADDYQVQVLQLGGGCVAGTGLVPESFDGAVCIGEFAHAYTTDGELEEDTEFEAECRAETDEALGVESIPGVPAGGVELDDGTSFAPDAPFLDCSLANVMRIGLDGAGTDLTKQRFYDAVVDAGDIPLAGLSDGVGRLEPDKPYLTTALRVVEFRGVPSTATRGADGLYGGCAAPTSCYLIASGWFPLDPDLR